MLKPGGLFLNHGIARHGKLADLALLKGLNTPGQTISGGPAYLEKKVLGQGSFVQHDIFPDTVNLIFRLAVQISMFNDARLCEL